MSITYEAVPSGFKLSVPGLSVVSGLESGSGDPCSKQMNGALRFPLQDPAWPLF